MLFVSTSFKENISNLPNYKGVNYAHDNDCDNDDDDGDNNDDNNDDDDDDHGNDD